MNQNKENYVNSSISFGNKPKCFEKLIMFESLLLFKSKKNPGFESKEKSGFGRVRFFFELPKISIDMLVFFIFMESETSSTSLKL